MLNAPSTIAKAIIERGHVYTDSFGQWRGLPVDDLHEIAETLREDAAADFQNFINDWRKGGLNTATTPVCVYLNEKFAASVGSRPIRYTSGG
ncbi:hypothetical protein Br6_04929 [Rhodococcus sp. Br-6]|nr:hypothetical protein Br6_04929 [Rhodococcus sp. Br-6]